MVTDKLNKNHLKSIYPALCSHISSYRSNKRLYIVKILSLFEQLPMELDAEHREHEECDVMNIMVAMEEVPVNIQEYRDKVLQLKKLGVLVDSERVPEFYLEAICRIAFGTLRYTPFYTLNCKTKCLFFCRTLNRQLPTLMGRGYRHSRKDG
jgi:hypothetical protein